MLCACAGIDVPAVIAPPGRTRATARMRQQGNSLSRPSSVHVDDFQRSVGAKESPAHRSSGPNRSGGPGSSGQREHRHGSSPAGGPSLQKLLSDPAVVAVRSASLHLCRVCRCTSVTSWAFCWHSASHVPGALRRGVTLEVERSTG